MKPVPRFKSTLTADDTSNLYLIGGLKADMTIGSTMFMYDVSERKWHCIEATSKSGSRRTKSAVLGPRYAHVAVYREKIPFSGRTNKGQIIVHGGYGSNIAGTVPKSSLHMYDIYRKEWSILKQEARSGVTPPARAEHTAVLLENRWYLIFGGRDKHLSPTADVYVFDLHRNKWSRPRLREGDKFPTGRAGHMMVQSVTSGDNPLECIVFGGVLGRSRGDEILSNEVFRIALIPDNRSSSQEEILQVSCERVKVLSVSSNQPDSGDEEIPQVAYGTMIGWKEEKAYVVIGGFGETGAIKEPFMIKVLDESYEDELAKSGRHLAGIGESSLTAKRKIESGSHSKNLGETRPALQHSADNANVVADVHRENVHEPIPEYSSPLNEYLASVSDEAVESLLGKRKSKGSESNTAKESNKRPRTMSATSKKEMGEDTPMNIGVSRSRNIADQGDEVGLATPQAQLMRGISRLGPNFAGDSQLSNDVSGAQAPPSVGSSVKLDPKRKSRAAQQAEEAEKATRAKQQAERRALRGAARREANRGRGRRRGGVGRSTTRKAVKSNNQGQKMKQRRTVDAETQLSDDSDRSDLLSKTDYDYLLERLEEVENELLEGESTIKKEREEKEMLREALSEFKKDNDELRKAQGQSRNLPQSRVLPDSSPSLTAEVSRLRAHVLHLEEFRKKLEDEVKEGKKSLEDANNVIKEKEGEVIGEEVELKRLKKILEKKNESLRVAGKKERELQKEIEEAKLLAKNAAAKQQKNETDLLATQKNVEALKDNLRKSEDRNSIAQEELKASEMKATESKRRIEELSEQYARLTCKVDELSEQNTKLITDYGNAQETVMSLEEKLAEVQKNEKSLSVERTQADDDKQQLKTRVSDAEKDLAVAQNELLKLSEKLTKSHVETEKSKRELVNSNREVKRLTTGLSNVRSMFQNQLDHVSSLFDPTVRSLRDLVIKSPSLETFTFSSVADEQECTQHTGVGTQDASQLPNGDLRTKQDSDPPAENSQVSNVPQSRLEKPNPVTSDAEDMPPEG